MDSKHKSPQEQAPAGLAAEADNEQNDNQQPQKNTTGDEQPQGPEGYDAGLSPAEAWKRGELFPIAEDLSKLKSAVKEACAGNSQLDAALTYVKYGVPVFPCKETPDRGKTVASKAPYMKGEGGLYLATIDPGQIKLWWARWPNALIGVPMGRRVGMWGGDPDTKEAHGHDGRGAWKKLQAEHGPATTRSHLTGTDGEHNFFIWDRDHPIGCSRGRLPSGIEVKGEGGYVIFPPSPYIWEGKEVRYRVLNEGDPAAAPTWLYELISGARPRAKGNDQDGTQYDWPPEFGERKLQEICELVRTATKHHWDEACRKVFKVGRWFGGGAGDVNSALAALLDAAMQNPGSPADYPSNVERAFLNGMAQPEGPPITRINGFEWPHGTILGKKGRPASAFRNIMIALRASGEMNGTLYFDEMALCAMVARPFPRAPGAKQTCGPFPRPWGDRDDAQLMEWLQHIGLSSIGISLVKEAALLLANENKIHPVREYLNGLRWDGVPRLDTWLHVYCRAENNEYTRGIGTMQMTASVARIYEPGCKGDYIVVLLGPQGLGKSKIIQILGDKWFSDSLPSIGDSAEVAIYLQGVWQAELPELSAIRKAEIEKQKAWATRQNDRHRPKYGRHTVDQPRQCVFWGTSNKDDFLFDPTGNRRSWPVRVAKIDAEGLRRDRDQLFAEAVFRYRNGEQYYPDREWEAKYAVPEQAEHTEEDAVWGEAVRGFLDRCGVTKCRISTIALFALDMDEPKRVGKADQNRIIEILEKMGWRRGKRTAAGRPYYAPGCENAYAWEDGPGFTDEMIRRDKKKLDEEW
jgi:predicted P-loop ATPase